VFRDAIPIVRTLHKVPGTDIVLAFSKPVLSQLQSETSFSKPVFNLTSLLFTIFHGKKMYDPKFASVVHFMLQGFSSHHW
jgi:hypothetical protein